MAPDPDRLARQVADAMWARDRASQDLGMRVVDVGAGRARLAMTVRDDMLNGHGICHGGFIFTLADSAFAYACNSRNHNTVAGSCAIEYLQPGQPGDVLTATAVESALSGRTGIYDVSVVNQQGELVAAFRGRSVRVRGDVLSGMQAAGAR